MCGVVGISGHQNVNLDLYDALTVLQHRGQDAAGIVTCSDGHFYQKKGVAWLKAYLVPGIWNRSKAQ